MGDTILLRRGTAANLPDLQEGEPGFATDSEALYIGDSTGTAESASYIGGGVYIDALQYEPNTYTQATIEAALTAIGTTDQVTLLLRPGTWVISSNANWSTYTNVTFKIPPGAVLQIATGTTTTFGGPVDAGPHQIFSCTGTGAVAGLSSPVYPEWWGAKADGSTDDQAAFQKAVDSVNGTVRLRSTKTYALGSAVTTGTTNPYIEGDDRNGATIKALTAFTGGLIILNGGGLKHVSFTGAGATTSGHVAITIGDGTHTNPLVYIEDVLNNGGFYDFIKSVSEFDNAIFKQIVSNVAVGHSVMDMQTTVSAAYAPSASPKFQELSFRNPDTAPTIGALEKYGLILSYTEEAVISGVITNFGVGIYLGGESGISSKETHLKDLAVGDLRSTVANPLWETEWTAGETLATGIYRKPTASNVNGHFYKVTIAGTADAVTEPTWPTTHNDTVVDGSITWTEAGTSIGILIGINQQTSIENTRCEDMICALYEIGANNIFISSSRLVGEKAAIVHDGANQSEILMVNSLTSGGTIVLTKGGGSALFTGIHNNIATTTDVPDHQSGIILTKGAVINNGFTAFGNDATPSVLGGSLFLTGGTTTITDFDDGVTGQIIRIVAEHSLTITDGTNIFLNGSANWTMTATDTLTLICKADNKWYELSRGDNGA